MHLHVRVVHSHIFCLLRSCIVGCGGGSASCCRRGARIRPACLCRCGRLCISHYVKKHKHDAQNDEEWKENEEPRNTRMSLVTQEVKEVCPDYVHEEVPHGGEEVCRSR